LLPHTPYSLELAYIVTSCVLQTCKYPKGKDISESARNHPKCNVGAEKHYERRKPTEMLQHMTHEDEITFKGISMIIR
jgi:hypothetical protein